MGGTNREPKVRPFRPTGSEIGRFCTIAAAISRETRDAGTV